MVQEVDEKLKNLVKITRNSVSTINKRILVLYVVK